MFYKGDLADVFDVPHVGVLWKVVRGEFCVNASSFGAKRISTCRYVRRIIDSVFVLIFVQYYRIYEYTIDLHHENLSKNNATSTADDEAIALILRAVCTITLSQTLLQLFQR